MRSLSTIPRALSSTAAGAPATQGRGYTPPAGPARPRPSAPAPDGGRGEQPAPPEPDMVSVRDIVAMLRRQWWVILGVMTLIVGAAGFLAARTRPLYRAQASLRLANPRRAITSNIADEAQGGSDNGADQRVSKIQLLTSRSFLSTAVSRDPAHLQLRVEGVPVAVLKDLSVAPDAASDSVLLDFGPTGVTAHGEQGSATAPYGAPLAIADVRFSVHARPRAPHAVLRITSADQMVNRVRGGLSARQRELADVIDVTYTDGDPLFAQQAVNSVVQTFAAGDIKDAQGTSQLRRVFIEQQLRQNDSLLAGAQASLAAFRARQGTFSARDQFTNDQRDIAGLGAQRETLLSERAEYETLLAGLARAGGATAAAHSLPPLTTLASGGVIAPLYNQVAALQTRRDSLTTGPWAHAATHPDVQQLDTMIAAAEAKLLEATRAQMSSIDDRLQRITGLTARSSTALQRLPAVEAEELRLSTQVESLSKLGDQLRAEYQKARISEAVQVGDVEILDLATLPDQPIGSSPWSRVIVGLVLGLAAGCGAAVLRERLDTSLARQSDVQDVLHLPTLAVIPPMQGARGQRMLRALRRRDAAEPQPFPVLDPAAAEAFVALRTNLTYTPSRGAAHTIVVTSSAPGDGKTTVSSNLARAFAQQGSRVLLVDCDLRRSRVHATFGVRSRPGLAEVLQGTATDLDAIVATVMPNLYVLPAGQAPSNPSELLGGSAMTQLLDHTGATFDIVILDTPPCLAVSDAAIVATRADGVVFVVRAGSTPRDAALMSVQQLTSVGAHVLGAALNDPDDRVASYPGYYEYAAYYARSDAKTSRTPA